MDQISSTTDKPGLSSELLHHGAAATSSSKAAICIPTFEDGVESSEIIYASHSILNVARCVQVQIGEKKEPVWTVYQTLRTNSKGSARANTTVSTYTAQRVVSCIGRLRGSEAGNDSATIVCGFTDGTVSTWRRQLDKQWAETILVRPDDEVYWDGRAVTDIAGICKQDDHYCIVACSSGGAVQYCAHLSPLSTEFSSLVRSRLISTPANSVRFHNLGSQPDTTLLLVGTAAPRNNKIHVFVIYGDFAEGGETHYCGALSGHEDWITCFDWRSSGSLDHLASGSQDARIRLWKFSTILTPNLVALQSQEAAEVETVAEGGEHDDEDEEDDEDIAEGESRLEVIVPQKSQSSVTLEALLIGHEEGVTSICWHPNPKPVYGEELVLISSSMDRSIFIWSEVSGIWAPISRVGTAGGILGGSIGSSLLGYLSIQLEPRDGTWMMGHGYGGALHFFSNEKGDLSDSMSIEERAALSPWKAQPCITGHFADVMDLCWESARGDYLLTVAKDQTCRVWVPLEASTEIQPKQKKEVWIELARPQVHGYDLTAVTSISTQDHRHLLVSGADEKELRVFDATKTFASLFGDIHNKEEEESTQRVDRAFIPSLGLSNKASAAEGAEQDSNGVSESSTQLPLERDLGAVSVWPEIGKLYGHNTELVRLASTTASTPDAKGSPAQTEVIVASSAKARDADDACIRLWNISEQRCLQVLAGGHRSTVTALCFSPDSDRLVSSGKDRRLCVWSRINKEEFVLVCAKDLAHKRIVWAAHFCPFDSSTFSTCSRDGSVKIWKISSTDGGNENLQETAVFTPRTLLGNGKPDSVTSVAFAPIPVTTSSASLALLAIGLENGIVEVWYVPLNTTCDPPVVAYVLPPEHCHIASVTKLAWRPTLGEDLVLAGASADHGCRIWRLHRSSA